MARGRHTPLDYLFFLRPVLLPPVWTIALLGTLGPDKPVGLNPWGWTIFVFHLTCLFGGVYTLNQICDIESDRLNRKLFFLPDGIISVRSAWVFTICLDLAALGMSCAINLTHLMLSMVLVVLGVLYSVGPRPWKARPVLGLISNSLGHGTITFLLGAAFARSVTIGDLAAAVPYTLAVGAVYLATTVPDLEGDRQTGKRTAAVTWGAGFTMIAATTLVTAAIVAAAIVGDRYFAFAGLAAWPFFLHAWSRSGDGSSTAAKAAVGALSIAACFAFPVYLVVLILGFIGTRLFFRWRFGVTYPNFL